MQQITARQLFWAVEMLDGGARTSYLAQLLQMTIPGLIEAVRIFDAWAKQEAAGLGGAAGIGRTLREDEKMLMLKLDREQERRSLLGMRAECRINREPLPKLKRESPHLQQ